MDDVATRIEHTVLGPTTRWADVECVLDEASEYGMRACVPPCYVEQAVDYAPDVPVATVVGFPHGQHPTGIKCREANAVRRAGAAEIDVVANVGLLKAGNVEGVRAELEEIVASVSLPVKVIIETPLLEGGELDSVCDAAETAGADYLKTATGFSDGGATVEDVAQMSEYLPVKASGGVGSWAFASDLFDAGAERIGASSGDTIVREYREHADA